MASASRLKLAVWKFASCDGCQLSLLDCEEELLTLAEIVDIVYFKEASSSARGGPYDLSLVDGSITTAHDVKTIHEIRRASRRLVAIGACAIAGGIQGLRNFRDLPAMMARVYRDPEHLDALPMSTAIANHVPVEMNLPGCPVNKRQLLEVINALVHGRAPVVPSHSVCVECKLRLNVCVMVTGTPCMGPVTHAGCDALCPTYERGCYGCFGPMETPNLESLARTFRSHGMPEDAILRVFRTFNANAPAFRAASEAQARLLAGGQVGPPEPRLLALEKGGRLGD